MTSFYVGDKPTTPVVLAVPDDIDLSAFTALEVQLVAPDRQPVLGALSGQLADTEATLAWTSGTVLSQAGIYTVRLVAKNAVARQTIAQGRIVVETEDGWHSLASARDEWADAPANDAVLFNLLANAKVKCLAYAPEHQPGSGTPPTGSYFGLVEDPTQPGYLTPVLEDGNGLPTLPPTTWVAAQLLHARTIYGAGRTATGSWGGEYQVNDMPLTIEAKALLRPNRGKPVLW